MSAASLCGSCGVPTPMKCTSQSATRVISVLKVNRPLSCARERISGRSGSKMVAGHFRASRSSLSRHQFPQHRDPTQPLRPRAPHPSIRSRLPIHARQTITFFRKSESCFDPPQLISATGGHHRSDCAVQDDDVAHHGPVFDVIQVKADAVVPRQVRPAADLPQTCDPRFHQ